MQRTTPKAFHLLLIRVEHRAVPEVCLGSASPSCLIGSEKGSDRVCDGEAIMCRKGQKTRCSFGGINFPPALSSLIPIRIYHQQPLTEYLQQMVPYETKRFVCPAEELVLLRASCRSAPSKLHLRNLDGRLTVSRM
jgi:hypothetical protein